MAHGSSASVTILNVTPSLGALFSAVRMSCHFLPLNASSGRSIRLSSATCTLCQPRASVTSAVALVQEKM